MPYRNSVVTLKRACFGILALVTQFLLFGCEPAKKPTLPPGTNPLINTSESKELRIPHPEYSNWSRFDVGAGVVRTRLISNKLGTVRVTTKLELSDKSKDAIAFTTQVSVERPGEQVEKNPEETTKVPASFRLPEGLSEEYFQLPSPKAKLLGEESIELFGKVIIAEVYEWTESNETGPMKVKLWRSDEVPGRIVRQEMLIEATQTKTIEELSDIKWTR
ncbi:MAG: hypothetical protein ACK5E3_09605 [Planctomycetota bacterium]|jgi:hypothetical protein